MYLSRHQRFSSETTLNTSKNKYNLLASLNTNLGFLPSRIDITAGWYEDHEWKNQSTLYLRYICQVLLRLPIPFTHRISKPAESSLLTKLQLLEESSSNNRLGNWKFNSCCWKWETQILPSTTHTSASVVGCFEMDTHLKINTLIWCSPIL